MGVIDENLKPRFPEFNSPLNAFVYIFVGLHF